MPHHSPSTDRKTYSSNVPVLRESLIGRDRELTQVRDLLLREDVGLVTLTGTGGTGKTRLAVQVAAEVLDSFGDGVFVVSLAAVKNPELIMPAIARVLGIEEAGDRPLEKSVRAYLRDKCLLLLLDNLEHLLDGVVVVADLLAGCPNLKILATSRAALRLTGEQEVPVPPLALPDLTRLPDSGTLSQTASVALFLQRATAIRSDFELTDDNARAVAEICVRLDGLPLAIELAAARLKLFSPVALVERLSHRLDILTRGARDLPARQRTLRDTISWSYDLLTTEEQQVFQRLSVFAGGFTLSAVESVSATDSDAFAGAVDGPPDVDVTNTLASLVDNSLVGNTSGSNNEPRFEMLETIREYAVERLEASGDAETYRRRHAVYYLSQAESAEPVLFGGDAEAWLAHLEEEHDNLRAALQWAFDRDETALALRIAGALAWFWYDHGHLSEGRGWLDSVLSVSGEAPSIARAKALIGAGGIAHRQFDLPAAGQYLKAGLGVSREIGDDWGSALALINLGLVAHDQGDYSRARHLHEESLDLCRTMGQRWGIGVSLNNLSWAALFTGDYQRARSFGEEALALRRDLGDTLGVAHTLYTLGRVALEEGDEARARTLLAEAITSFNRLGVRWGLAACLETLAIASGTIQRGSDGAIRAARLWGAAEAVREALGAPLTPTDRRVHERHQSRVRARIEPDIWAAAWAAGRAMPVTEALDEAMADLGSTDQGWPAPTNASQSLPAGLTAREVEVLQLVTEGLSNADVAARLHLSPRTVGQHLRSIYNKIGVGSRAAATRFAVENRLV